MNNLQTHFRSMTNLQVSQEAVADGKSKVEKEIVIFGKIVDFDELKKADRIERQEQWEIRPKETGTKFGGGIRIRCIDEKQYILTIKTYQPNKGDLVETETELDPEAGRNMINELKKLTATGMIKTRHCFNVPDSDLVWEVDVYYDDKGEPRKWCKIDLEVTDLRVARPEYPIQLKDAREIPPKNRSEEDQAFVDRLMQREFRTDSPHIA